MSCMVSSVVHIKNLDEFLVVYENLESSIQSFSNVSHDKLKIILLFGAHARGEQVKKWQLAASLEL